LRQYRPSPIFGPLADYCPDKQILAGLEKTETDEQYKVIRIAKYNIASFLVA